MKEYSAGNAKGKVLKTAQEDFWRSNSEPRSRGKRKNQSNFSKQERKKKNAGGRKEVKKKKERKWNVEESFFEDVCHFPPTLFSSSVNKECLP
ncbi:hypothetical protein CEXT_418901 [Caerostris extrusa]|uniref:Uncharacterized protein n=1 Tax=Caerostris extrusa TaxID=172846 RepID=A0AAV4P5T2_CAEEX|nr:hypothetical protein CEXT_418901 [Caerostris extrusa]